VKERMKTITYQQIANRIERKRGGFRWLDVYKSSFEVNVKS